MQSGLSRLTSQTHAKFVVVEDNYVGEHTHEARAQLRSLPFLIEHGFNRIVHTDLWDNDFKPVSYTYLPPDEVDPENVEFPLVHVVSQEGMTEYGEQHLVRSLLKNQGVDDTYILVCDSNAPRTPVYTPSRPITDEFTPNVGLHYENSVSAYIRRKLNSTLPVSNTRGSKNLYYHQISDCHNRFGAPADTLPELFDYEVAPPESPAWEPLYYFVEHDLEQVLERYTERIREALRSWTERGDVQRIANNMDSMLSQCQFRADKLDQKREQNQELYAND